MAGLFCPQRYLHMSIARGIAGPHTFSPGQARPGTFKATPLSQQAFTALEITRLSMLWNKVSDLRHARLFILCSIEGHFLQGEVWKLMYVLNQLPPGLPLPSLSKPDVLHGSAERPREVSGKPRKQLYTWSRIAVLQVLESKEVGLTCGLSYLRKGFQA